jgi:DNA-directed RNA polymerase subunit H (RpoH/RPB5)
MSTTSAATSRSRKRPRNANEVSAPAPTRSRPKRLKTNESETEDDENADPEEEEGEGEEEKDKAPDGVRVAKDAKTATKPASSEDDDKSESSDEDKDESSSESDESSSESENEEEDDEEDEDGHNKDAAATDEKAAVALAPTAVRLSAATMKTRMSPSMLQNPLERQKIWVNLQRMMVRRGYRWEQHSEPPTAVEQLLPNNKGYLGTFHLHGIDTTDAKREPVYVIFCSKAGEPTLKSLEYPSRHIILVADSLTGRARTVLHNLALKTPPSSTTTTPTAPSSSSSSTVTSIEPPTGMDGRYIEAFASNFFMFDLLRQRYLNTVEFSPLVETDPELEHVLNLFERGRDRSHFPRMLDSDPVARYLRVDVGAVLKQERLSTSAGRHLSYRALVPSTGPR